MQAAKTIKKYISAPAWLGIAAWILTAITVLSLLTGLVKSAVVGSVAAQEFYPDYSAAGTQAYIDVVGVSEWLYKNDDAIYYTVEDAEGYFYTVRMKNTQFKKMTAQQEYWKRTSEDTPVPDAYRLSGCVRETSSVIRSSMSQAWGITTAEYSQYFGATYLDTTTSAGAEAGVTGYALALLCGIFALALLLSYYSVFFQAKKSLAALEERGLLERAAAQMESGVILKLGKDRGRLTEQFVFGKATGVVVRYDEILWAYQRTHRTNFVVTNTYLVVNTRQQKNMNAIALGKKDKSNQIAQALLTIYQHNPRALVGYTPENAQRYKQMAKEQG